MTEQTTSQTSDPLDRAIGALVGLATGDDGAPLPRRFPASPATVVVGDSLLWIGLMVELGSQDEPDGPSGWLDVFAMGEVRIAAHLSKMATASTPGLWRGETYDRHLPVVVRPTREEDAVNAISLFGELGIPLPIPVIAAIHSMDRAIPRPTLWALSQNDGVVTTMMIRSEAGRYLRYSGRWHELADDGVVEGLNVTEVEGDSLATFDRFDRAGQFVEISGLTRRGERPL